MLAGAVALLLGAASPSAATPITVTVPPTVHCPYGTYTPTPQTVAEARRATLCLVNLARAHRHLPIIHTNPALRDIARGYALDMMHQNFFAHVTPGGRTVADRARAAGYFRGTLDWGVGEALGWGQQRYATPLGAVASWMSSPRHRALLLTRRYTEMGIGVAFGSPRVVPAGTTYKSGTYVATFGFRKLP